jgi:hypothetical protein
VSSALTNISTAVTAGIAIASAAFAGALTVVSPVEGRRDHGRKEADYADLCRLIRLKSITLERHTEDEQLELLAAIDRKQHELALRDPVRNPSAPWRRGPSTWQSSWRSSRTFTARAASRTRSSAPPSCLAARRHPDSHRRPTGARWAARGGAPTAALRASSDSLENRCSHLVEGPTLVRRGSIALFSVDHPRIGRARPTERRV